MTKRAAGISMIGMSSFLLPATTYILCLGVRSLQRFWLLAPWYLAWILLIIGFAYLIWGEYDERKKAHTSKGEE